LIHLQFDGIYMNADIWLNGQHLGNHPYGYTSFMYDITDKLLPGKNNALAVRVGTRDGTAAGTADRVFTGMFG